MQLTKQQKTESDSLKILVTGSFGFVGKRLIEQIKKEHQVFSLDRENLSSSIFFKADITKKEELSAIPKDFDIIIHLAAILDESSDDLFKVNVDGTKNLIEFAKENKNLKQFIFLSSVGVLGETKEPANEETMFNPVTNYERSKFHAEEFVKSSSLPYTIIRPALIYGPNQWWKSIIKIVKKDFPLIGKGENYWQLVFIDDLIDGIMLTINNQAAINETYIFAEETPTKVIDIVNTIRKKLNKKGKQKTIPIFAGRILAKFMPIFQENSLIKDEYIDRLLRDRRYDVSKAKNKLGFETKTTLDSGIEKTIKELGLNN